MEEKFDFSLNKKDFDLAGIFPPIPTPFNKTGEIYISAIKRNLKFWNQFEFKGYVVLGSTGEFVLLEKKEKLKLIEKAREAIPGEKLLIAGTGCQSTKETIELTNKAALLGVDAVLLISPFYYKNKMSQEIILEYFFKVAENSSVPVIVYNMPIFTGIDLSAKIITRISEHPNIVGLKDSGGDLAKFSEIRVETEENFQILIGSANFFVSALSRGAVGGIISMANIAPVHCLAIQQHFRSGELKQAQKIQRGLVPVNNIITRDYGVAALKSAMDMMGLYGGPVRSPLLAIPDGIRGKLAGLLKRSDLLR